MKIEHILLTALLILPTPLLADGVHKRLSPRAKIMATPCSRTAQGQEVTAYLLINSTTLDYAALDLLGVKLTLQQGNIATAQVPVESMAALSQVAGVEYVQAAASARQQMDLARQETGADAMYSGTGLPQAFTGKGVVVGIVDSGFEYTHEAFRSPDGSLRIKRVWEQDASSASSASPNVSYGIEFTTEEEILAAASDIRNNTHGTHVTSIAASSSWRNDGALRGIAPEADIVLVSISDKGSDNVNISNAIAYIFNYADEVGKPCVVNLSLGTHSGPHDGTSLFDQLADQMQGPGRLIVGSAGNHQENNFHIHRDITEENLNKPIASFVNYITTPSVTHTGGDIEVWTDCHQLDAALVVYKLSTGDEIERATIDLTAEEPASISLGRRVTGSFTVASETSPLNGKTHLLLQSAVTAIQTGYAIAIELTPHVANSSIDIWADDYLVTLSSRSLEGFTAPTSSDPTICEIGGTAKRIMTVGAYTTRADYYVLGNSDEQHLTETLGDICSFSNFGPTADGRTKPQVSAPGAYICAAMSQYGYDSNNLAYYFNDSGQDTFYGYMQGTSMAAPFVTGIVAAWLEAYPQLSPEELAYVIKSTSRTDSYTGTIPDEGNTYWGYGKIDALGGLQRCIELANESSIGNTAFSNGTLHDGIYDLSGRKVGTSIEALPAGVYILKITIGSKNHTKKFVIR